MATAARLSAVTIENFKNVEHGHIDFAAPSPLDGASMTGIFGQNGSGKTAVIDALSVLKCALMGNALPEGVGEEIRNSAERARFVWDFCVVEDRQVTQSVRYSFDLVRTASSSVLSPRDVDSFPTARIENEILEFLGSPDLKGRRRHMILDTSRGEVFGPPRQYAGLTGAQGIRMKANLVTEKRNALTAGRSFAFSPYLLEQVRSCSRNRDDADLLIALADYGTASLLVLTTQDVGTVVFDQLCIHYRSLGSEEDIIRGLLLMPLEEPAWINEATYRAGSALLETLSVVLDKLVPGRRIGFETLRTNVSETGEAVYFVRVVSVTENGPVPLRHESEGIKKIVNVLQLLVAAYCDAGITLAVDELDSGVFEYLLGELMQVLDGGGKGQIIFTSHNLRSLEVLRPRNAVFTTTDPRDRYYRMKGVRENKDLRRLYFQEVLLGGVEKELYSATDNLAITEALREAGEQAWRVSKFCS